jgi:glycosyltransferase involved in cell wall biosynthesis
MTPSGIDISVIVPCLNEAPFIQETLRRLLGQEGAGSAFTYEILIVDGMSTDGTREILAVESARHPQIRVIDNKKRITPCAFNAGIAASSGRYICILGAHAEIEPDYLSQCLGAMKEVDADSVGGPWRAKGKGYMGQAIALAFQNPVAVGLAKAHMEGFEGYVDTVWGGFFKREVFERIGLYDEEFVRGQDAELNRRLVRSGGKIWQTPKIRYSYYCRDQLSKLWRLYLQTGYWKVKLIHKHRQFAAGRHLIVAIVLCVVALLLASAPFSAWARYALAGLAGLYLIGSIVTSLLVCLKPGRLRFLPVMPLVLATYHLGYALGFARGLVDFFLLRVGRNQVDPKGPASAGLPSQPALRRVPAGAGTDAENG